jgi:hypothetical protein
MDANNYQIKSNQIKSKLNRIGGTCLVEVRGPQELAQEFYLSCWELIRGRYCDDNTLSLYGDENCENAERLHQIARILVVT